MKNDFNEKLASKEFTLEIDKNQCIRRILPNIKTVRARTETIGAIADEEAISEKTLTSFFDPKVSGTCTLQDYAAHVFFSSADFPKIKDFKISQQWKRERDHWVWRMDITLQNGPDREIQVDLVLPHPVFPGSGGSGHSRWNLWMPISGAPFDNDYGIKTMHFCKCVDEVTDTPLPLCTLYHASPDLSLGFSYLLPPDQRWYVDFEFRQRISSTRLVFQNIALTSKKKVHLEMWCFSHAGDWRPALGWVREKFPGLLGPVKGQEKVDGNMAYTIPMIPEKRIKDWAGKMNYKWNELFHCQHFGTYAPEEPFDATQFQSPEHPEKGIKGLTYDDLRRYIETCHKNGVNVMSYFNISDCESGLAQKSFRKSIARITNGAELVTWNYYDRKHFTLLMNCDPQYAWFNHVLEQFQLLVKKIPEIDGFFFDQMSYGWIDTAHFDGETFYNNKPAYNLANAYLRALKIVREVFPRPRITGIGNGPFRWQLMEYIDGAMAEGSPRGLGTMAMICPERPTMCLAEGEHAFQTALHYGSWLHVSPYYRYPTTKPLPKDAVALFAMYNPLFEFLPGRKWVYAANPIVTEIKPKNQYLAPLLGHSDKIKSNIFATGWGEYAAVILAVPFGGMVREKYTKDVHVKIKVPGMERLKTAVVFGADYRGYYVIKPALSQNGSVEIVLPKHGAASMIILTESVAKLKKIKNWSKLKEPIL
ncbi:MAG: hypothetical protein NTY10_05695 [Candidatus Omnitrophica bacterium]|nr:hypothetical protein [Candidatus Omnitrophota bacterium]